VSAKVTVVDGASIIAYALPVSKISPKLITACRVAYSYVAGWAVAAISLKHPLIFWGLE